MKYTSTRSGPDVISCTFEEAICTGYAPDGGLFVPIVTLPPPTRTTAVSVDDDDGKNNHMIHPEYWITTSKLKEWQSLSFLELMYTILRIFIDPMEIPNQDLKDICHLALQPFPVASTTQQGSTLKPKTNDISYDTIPVLPMIMANNNNNNSSSNMYVSELFHGPTYCFKDLGMRIVIGILSYFATKPKSSITLEKEQREEESGQKRHVITLLVSTTGDTGPAAVRAVADYQNPFLNIIVHYPGYHQISNFQRKQLTTIHSNHVHIVEFNGGGDDMDQPIKNLLHYNKEKQQQQTIQQQQQSNDHNSSGEDDNLSSLWTGVNSYNIGRPLTQMVHFIWTYLRVIESLQQKQQQEKEENESELNRSDKNENDNHCTNTVQMGDYIDIILPTGAMGNIAGGYFVKLLGLPIRTLVAGVNANDITHRVIQTGCFHKAPTMHKTLSDAINIQVPYNFERLLYYLTDQNHTLVKEWMIQLQDTDKITLPSHWLQRLQHDFKSATVSDEEMCTTIQWVLQQYSYLPDPHTAVAFSAAKQLGYFDMDHDSTTTTSTTITDNTIKMVGTALLATASPCKFEESMTIAIGTERWNEYYQSDQYPNSARIFSQHHHGGDGIDTIIEKQPTLYETDPIDTYEITQNKWEQRTYEIIQQMEKK